MQGVAVWNLAFDGWFPKSTPAEVGRFLESLNDQLDKVLASAKEDDKDGAILNDLKTWLMDEMLRLLEAKDSREEEQMRDELGPQIQVRCCNLLHRVRAEGVQARAAALAMVESWGQRLRCCVWGR